MNLLFKRDQKSAQIFTLIPLKIGSGVSFSLWAELELDDEEAALIKKYQFAKSALVISDPIDDLKQSFRPAAFLGFVLFVVWSIIGSVYTALIIGLLVTVVMTIIYFKTQREQILVSDLMHGGRTFRCDSVVELIQKEAFLEGVTGYLRQVVESAKNWGDRDVIEIKPLDKAAAKQAVMQALHN